jgi:hypothetical protein
MALLRFLWPAMRAMSGQRVFAQRGSAAMHTQQPPPPRDDASDAPPSAEDEAGAAAAAPAQDAAKQATGDLPREMHAATSYFNHNLTALQSGLARADAKIDGVRAELEVLRGDVSELRTDVSELRTDVSELREGVSELRTDVSELWASHNAAKDFYLQRLSEISKGLGMGFEGFNAAWLQRVLAARGHTHAKVERRVTVPDPSHSVHAMSSQVEVDLYCRSPLVIVEATTFLGRKELGKLEAFARTGDLVSSIEGKRPEMLFCTYAVHRAIRSRVASFCTENSIALITSITSN